MRRVGLALATLALWCSTSTHAQAAVAQRSVSPTAVFDSGILRVERFGRTGARAIVLIPGLFCGSWQWNAQINALSQSYDVFAVTLPGLDGRPMIAGDDLMHRTAQSLDRLIATKHLNRPIVVGHSLGGTMAVFFAEHYPHDVTNVVTVEGGYPAAPTQAQRDASVAKATAPYRGIAQSEFGPVIRQTTLQYTITSKADIDAIEPLVARSDPDAIIGWLGAALSLDLTPGLSKIIAPFTVIIPFDPVIDPYQGFASQEKKRAAYVSWAAHALHPEVILIEPARHFVMFDQPEEFERALETAIAR